MVYRARLGLSGIVGLALFVVGGCAPKTVTVKKADGTTIEMSESAYMGDRHYDTLLTLSDRYDASANRECHPDYTEVEGLACQFDKIIGKMLYKENLEAVNNPGYWQLAIERENKPYKIIGAVNDSARTLGSLGLLPWKTGYSGSGGGTRIGGKGSDFRGSKWTVATDGSTVAQDESTAATNDSQAMRDPEKSYQSRSTSRPNFQPDLDQRGGSATDGDGGAAGSNNLNSEGFSAGLSTP